MSDTSQGPGWWQASDGKWYRPEQHPDYRPPPPPPPPGPGLGLSGVGIPPPPWTPAYPMAPPSTMGYPGSATQTTNGLAIASLVLSLLWFAGLGSILAVIFAVRGRKQIRESGGTQGGDGIATAGFIVGIVGIVGAIPFVLVFILAATVNVTHDNAVVAACQADAASVKTAGEAYKAEMGQWPLSLSVLTQTASDADGQTVGPWLKALPSTQNYTIFLDPRNGTVYVYPPNTARPGSFSPANAFVYSTDSPCSSVAS